jgi:hypothetical protein
MCVAHTIKQKVGMRGLWTNPAPSVVEDPFELTDADFDKYLGPQAGQNSMVQKRNRSEDDDPQQPQQVAYQGPPVPYDVRIVPRPPLPDMETLLGDDYRGPPILLNAERLPLIPYDVYMAAFTLLDGERKGDLKLGRETGPQLQQLITSFKHEYFAINPLVVLSDSIALPTTGVRLYVEEVVPISFVLLAFYLHSTFNMPGNYVRKPYSEMSLKPYEGRETPGCQRLGLQEQVHKELEQRGHVPANVFRELQIHMLRAGEMSPHEACDPSWIDECVQQMPGIVQGRHLVKKDTGGAQGDRAE